MKQTITLFLIMAATLSAQANKQAPAQNPNQKSIYAAAVWPAKHATWTQTTLLTVRTVLPALEKAQDIEEFCPGYAQANKRSREICWLRLIGGVAKFESAFNPRDMFMGFDGDKYSVGLMSLSPGESEIAPTLDMLKVPELNLQAGIEMMARYIGEQGYISGPEGARGAASYWATLSAPYKVGELNLGHREFIIKISSTYAQY